MVCAGMANCNVADDIRINMHVREELQSGSVVLSAIYTMVYVCDIFKCNDCDIKLKITPGEKSGVKTKIGGLRRIMAPRCWRR